MRPGPLLLVLTVGLAVACSDQGPDTVAGTYTLKTVNGKGPPWAEFVSYGQHDGLLTESMDRWIDDSLHLDDHATLRWTHVWETMVRAYDPFTGALVDSSVTTNAGTQHGDYALSGSTIELRLENGAEYTGSWEGNALTLQVEGQRYLYER